MAILAARNFPLDCGFAATGPTLSFAKQPINEESFVLSLSTIRRTTAEPVSPTETTIDDRVVTRSSSSAYVDDVVAVAERRGGYFGQITFASEATGVVSGADTNDGQFQFTHVANGTARVSATSDRGLKNVVTIAVGSGSSSNSDAWLQWAAGSLGSHVANAVTSRASATGVSVESFLLKDHVQSLYTRNPACWLYDVDISCLSVWNSISGQQRGGTLVTPEHCLFASHFSVSVGTIVRFVTAGASQTGKLTVEDRTVAAVGSIPFGSGDIFVARLNAAVSAPFCKVVPPDLMDYVPSVTRTKADNSLTAYRPRLPLVATNQDKHFGYLPAFELAGDWLTSAGIPGQAGYGSFEANTASAVAYPSLVPFVRSGCSGHPVFLLVDGELVFVGMYVSASAGTSFGSQATHDAVNAILTTLGGGYQLTEADLSGFDSY